MKYPTHEEIEAAGHVELARWARFLPSPGISALDALPEEFTKVLAEQRLAFDHIMERFRAFGGWTPEVSKAVGWG